MPRGFAHGFSVLSDSAEVLYKCDEVYAPECERGIRYNDPQLNIDWKVEIGMQIVSGKDIALPYLENTQFKF